MIEKTKDIECNPDDPSQCEEMEYWEPDYEQWLFILASDDMTYYPWRVCVAEGDCPNVDIIKSILT